MKRITVLRRSAFILFAGAISWPALAGPDSDMLKRSGLLGRWSIDCKRPPGKANVYYAYIASVDEFPVQTEQGYYDDETVVSQLRDVRIKSSTLVEYTSVGAKSTLYITELVEGRRRRTWSSVNKNGTVYVKDGLQNGQQTSWFEKCTP